MNISSPTRSQRDISTYPSDAAQYDYEFYQARGFDTFPLPSNSNKAILEQWQLRDPQEMWQHAPKDANIAVRCGGQSHTAVIDCDNKRDPQTSTRVFSYLDGLGLHDYPLVLTPHDGYHVHLRLDEAPAGKQYNKLPRGFGTGEFRYGRGAYAASPRSRIEGKEYRLVSGDFAYVPRVRLADLLPLIGNVSLADVARYPTLTSERGAARHKKLSRKARALLRGEGIEKYQSRSEAEQALIASLIESGYEFDEVLELFLDNPCAGKFSELYEKSPRNARRWLEHSFDNALIWTADHPFSGQILAERALEWADARQWTGQTGAVDRAVFIAHAEIARNSGRISYAAPCRDLADEAGVTAYTAAASTHRLMRMRLIRLEREATFNLAALYRIGNLEQADTVCTLTRYVNVSKCTNCITIDHDLFRAAGLGKTGAQIWELLITTDEPLTLRVIADRTGRAIVTVRKKLKEMRDLGMVEPGEIVGREITFKPVREVDLDEIARVLGTSGKGTMQRIRHQAQRRVRRDLFPYVRKV